MTDEATTRRFHRAISEGDLPAVRQLLESDPSLIRSKDAEGNGVLHLALPCGGDEIFNYLLSQGADPNDRDADGWTPLHQVCIAGFWLADSLIRAGADVNARNHLGGTPLHAAAMLRGESSLEYLLEQGADIDAVDDLGYTPLHCAITGNGNLKNARYLWDRGARRDIFGAVGLGKISFVRRLLRTDPALVDARDGKGLSPLHWAVMRSQRAIADLLLKHGADVNARDRLGGTPLHHVGRPDFWEAVPGLEDLLLRHGADVHAVNDGGETPLHCAAWGLKPRLIELLAGRGVDPNARDARGRTPLDAARERKKLGTGAFPHTPDDRDPVNVVINRLAGLTRAEPGEGPARAQSPRR